MIDSVFLNKIIVFGADIEIVQYFQLVFHQDKRTQILHIEDLGEELQKSPFFLNRCDILWFDFQNNSNINLQLLQLSEIRKMNLVNQIIVLSDDDSLDFVERSFAAGATGFLNKNEDLLYLETYVNSLYSGGIAISPNILKKIIWRDNPLIAVTPHKLQKSNLEKDCIELLCLMGSIPFEGSSFYESLIDIPVENKIKKIYRFLNVSFRYQKKIIVQNEISYAYKKLLEFY